MNAETLWFSNLVFCTQDWMISFLTFRQKFKSCKTFVSFISIFTELPQKSKNFFANETSPIIKNVKSEFLNFKFYPLAREANREVSNLTERKNPQTPVYGVKEFVCLSVSLLQTLTPIISGLAKNHLKKSLQLWLPELFFLQKQTIYNEVVQHIEQASLGFGGNLSHCSLSIFSKSYQDQTNTILWSFSSSLGLMVFKFSPLIFIYSAIGVWSSNPVSYFEILIHTSHKSLPGPE